MAERSTAAVGVAETSGENDKPLTVHEDGSTSDGATDATNGRSHSSESPEESAADPDNFTADSTADEATSEAGPEDGPGAEDEHGAGADTAADAVQDAGEDTAQYTPEDIGEGVPESAAEPEEPVRPNGAERTRNGTPRTPATARSNGSAPASAEADAAEDQDQEKPQPPEDPQAPRAQHDAEAAQTPQSPTGAKNPGDSRPTAAAEDAKNAKNTTDSKGAKNAKSTMDAKATSPAGATGGSGDADGSGSAPAPELHSGHKLAQRYRLEECVTRLDGFSSWRAVDEKLRRAVGVHVLPAAHPRARQVLAAARSAALLGDPRFVQVLDAVEEGALVYVVHEWLPDATPLDELLAAGPLEPHDAYQLISQLAQALTAAHREGLAHLRLTPTCVLRTGVGQYRVRGLAVNAALRGVTSEHAQRDDTEALGALLYASLTQRWPYEEDAHGLAGVGTFAKGTLLPPDQVRAGVHRGLSNLAMRALINDGATASRQEQPCATPEELSKAVAAMPRIRPPESAFTAPAPYQRTTYQQGAYAAGATQGPPLPPGAPAPLTTAEVPAPPALPGRTGKALKWGVSALLIAALGLGSWQVADALLKGDPPPKEKTPQSQSHDSAPVGKPVKIVDAHDFDPESPDGSENPDKVPDSYDGDPGTYWLTSKYIGRPNFGNLKSGAGIIYDLGKPRQVSSLKVDFIGKTSAGFLAAPESVNSTPSSLSSFSKVTSGSGEHLTLKAKKPIKTRYVLLWLTKLPLSEDGNYRGRVTEVQVVS